jgi:hypothetical protein
MAAFVPFFPWSILARVMMVIPGWIFRFAWSQGLETGQQNNAVKKD